MSHLPFRLIHDREYFLKKIDHFTKDTLENIYWKLNSALVSEKFDDLNNLLVENANLNPPGVKPEPYNLDYCMDMLRHELLGIAIESNNAKGAEVFLKNGGVILPYRGEEGLHVIEIAARNGYWQVVEVVARYTIGLKKSEYDFHDIAKPNYTELVCEAIKKNQLPTAKYLDLLLRERGDLNYNKEVVHQAINESESKNESLKSPSHCQSSTFSSSPKKGSHSPVPSQDNEEVVKRSAGNFGLG